MSPVRLADLPPAPPGKTGWPWTQEAPTLPPTRPDGSRWPRVSVVTPSWNQGQFLEETIRSVLLQGYPDLEYIVMDGGSTDESASILQRYKPWLAYCESEKDRGQGHAINKGLARSTGEIWNWINSDDVLCPGALERIAATFGERDAFAGRIVYFGEGEDLVGENKTLSPERILRDGGSFFQQPAIWVRRDALLRIGGVDERFHFAFDWELLVRYFHSHPDVVYSDVVLVRFRLHGDSKTMSHQDRFRAEMTTILGKFRKSDDFASLHSLCDQLIARRTLYAAISRATSKETRRPLRQMLRLALREPRVLRQRFFWGRTREILGDRESPTPIMTALNSGKRWLGALSRPLRERFLQRPHAMQGVVEGLRMGGYRSSYHDGTYEIALAQTLVRVVEPGWVCYDVGANRGYFTLLLGKLVGESGHVVAFEAHPDNAEQVRANARVNGFDGRVQVENIAVSDGSQTHLSLFPGREHRSEEWNIVGHDVDGNPTSAEIEIPATSLDNYRAPDARINLVKMDIEGAEVQAMPGMRRILRECRPLVLVEFHGENGWNSRGELLDAGYALFDVEARVWLDSDAQTPVYQCLGVPQELEKIRVKLA